MPDAKTCQATELLQASDLFRDVAPELLAGLVRNCAFLQLGDGEQLFAKGDPGDSMYVIAEGQLKVHDDVTIFNVLSSGDAFGEFALLESLVRTASVTAMSPCVLLRIAKRDFLAVLQGDPTLSSALIRSLIRRLTTEKDRAEKLLQNILPRAVAEEYKSTGTVKVRRFERASVMFTDFVGFTRISERLSPERVVEDLHLCFAEFDRIVDRHRLQRIKTTGDGYMCAGGIPEPNRSNPLDTVLAGLEMQRFVTRIGELRAAQGEQFWSCRIGINTGDCISAVIGGTKLTYDLWSDTVNTASRLESAGAPGRVNIGEITYRHVQDFFDCEARGEVGVKGKDPIRMYFVRGIRPELCTDAAGLEPNAAFQALRAARFPNDPQTLP